nr:MAG TPA: hypothetical protein [Caudoviricetes sp.]
MPSLSRRRGVLPKATLLSVPSQSPYRVTAAPGRPLLPCGQFTLSPLGEPLCYPKFSQ